MSSRILDIMQACLSILSGKSVFIIVSGTWIVPAHHMRLHLRKEKEGWLPRGWGLLMIGKLVIEAKRFFGYNITGLFPIVE